MASTYTSNSGVEKPGIGDQSGEWGTTVNTNMDILDRAINGVGVITLSGTTHTLTTTDGALSDGQYKVLVLSGSPSGTNTITISPNDQDKLYFVVNSSGQTATFSQGSGANVSVVNGDTKIIYADGAGSGAAVTEFASEVDALEGITAGTVAASKAVIVDANKDITGFRNVTLTGELDAGSLDVSGNADIDGTLEANAMTLNGTAITTTATLSTGISNTNVPVFTSGVADDDFLRVAGTSIEGRSAAEVLSDIGASAVAGSGSIVTTGALNSGSITSGFGAIDNGSSAITTTGVITGGTVEATTDTAAGDNAAIGYTSAEGLILTGQGSTSDFTVKNDADATVLSIPTGSGNVGIGTTAASTYANSMGNTLVVGTGNNFAVIQGRTDGASGSTNGVNYGGSYGTNPINGARMLIGAAGGAGQRGLVTFNTKNTDDDTNQPTEKMRIGADGNVGIGTSSPTGKLTVSSDIKVLGSNFASVEFTGASVNGSGVYTGLDSGGGYVVNVRDSGYIGFSTTNAERMRIDSSGKVGIGTSAPTRTLTVIGSVGNQFVGSQSQSNDTAKYCTYAGSHYHNSEQDVAGVVVLSNGTDNTVYLGGGVGELNAATVLAFHTGANDATTGGTERMRMLSDGQLIVAGTSFNANGSVTIGPIGTSSNGCTAVSASTSATNIWRFYNPNGHIGSISLDGSTCNFSNLSDYRLKENVNYTFDATTRLKQLKPARFNFISDDTNTLVDGFIAHEVSSVVPEAITGEKDAVDENGDAVYQGIDQSKLVPLLVKTIQELEARITALEAE